MGKDLVLHVTNGDMAGGVLQHAIAAELIPAGPVLPWRDVLHEGPVRAGRTLDELSSERAGFIAACGWGALPDVAADFEQRDALLRTAPSHEEVVLWFEHDLYDQLQLIQVLDWFAAHSHPHLSLICEAEYVGCIEVPRAGELFSGRQRVGEAELEEASGAWAAFTAPDPMRLERVSCSYLRFLGAALRRHLEEYPWISDGLSRTERAALDALRGGPLPFARIFLQVMEEPMFLGDLVLLWHLERMEREGLVRRQGDLWALVQRPERRREPRWLGGVLVDENSPWRWDPARGAVRKPG